MTGVHNSEVICPAETHISKTSSLTNPCNVKDTIWAMLLKCLPIKLLRYWIRYEARMGSMLVPSTLTEFSRACKTDISALDKSDTAKPQQYFRTPNRTVCSGSTAQSLCGSHPYNIWEKKGTHSVKGRRDWTYLHTFQSQIGIDFIIRTEVLRG